MNTDYVGQCEQIFNICLKDYETEIMHFQKGDMICRVDDTIKYLFFMMQGSAKAYYSLENGKSVLFEMSDRPMIFGDMELFIDTVYNAYVQALSDTVCICIPFEKYKEQFLQDVLMLNALGRTLALNLSRMTANSSVNMTYPLKQRLCAFIAQTMYNGYFTEHLGNTADILGTGYRHLLRVLKELCDENILEKTPKGYFIKDADTLITLGNDLFR